MGSSTPIADRLCFLLPLALALLGLAVAGGRAEAPAQDEVRIDLSTDAQKRIGLILEGFEMAGDRVEEPF